MATPITLRKKKVVRKILIDIQGGQVKFDRFELPESALLISGVKVTGQHIALLPVVANSTQYLYGTLASGHLTTAQLNALTVGTYVDTHPTFVTSTGAGEYIYFANPASLSDPVFVYMGFQGGFLDQGVLYRTTANGLVAFRVWRSTNPNLGLAASIQAVH